jgi:short-subunit dehydrogenase
MDSLPRADKRLRCALVTGACSGIGRAMADLLASLGFRLILVSQRPLELARASEEIRDKYGTTTHALPIDLARPGAAQELYDSVRAQGHEVDILVNNAGFFFFGETVDASVARATAMLQLHVVTPSLLCTLFGREMRTRGWGHILIVSSISAWRDFPGISYYGSSKKYLRGFARALRSELAPHGVNVTCLAPGATATALYDADVVPVERARRLGVMLDATTVAEAGLHALFAGKAEHVPGLLARAMALGAVLAPQWAVDIIGRRASWLNGRTR